MKHKFYLLLLLLAGGLFAGCSSGVVLMMTV